MSIYERYELLGIVNEGPVKTFSARQIQSGQPVAVHLLIAYTDPQNLMQKVRALPDPARCDVIEFGDHEGTPYVVTTEWRRMVTFPEWVHAVSMSSGAPAAAAAPPPVPTSDRFAKAGNWRIPVSEFG